jgi:hypothetical protein
VGFGVMAGVVVIISHFSYGTGSMLAPMPTGHTPIFAFKSNCYPRGRMAPETPTASSVEWMPWLVQA